VIRARVSKNLTEWIARVGDDYMNKFERVEENMVVIVNEGELVNTGLDCSVPRTDKGNIIRYAVYSQYIRLIEAVYKRNHH